LANKVVPAERLLEESLKMARKIGEGLLWPSSFQDCDRSRSSFELRGDSGNRGQSPAHLCWCPKSEAICREEVKANEEERIEVVEMNDRSRLPDSDFSAEDDSDGSIGFLEASRLS